jgi:hypothetical protein
VATVLIVLAALMLVEAIIVIVRTLKLRPAPATHPAA